MTQFELESSEKHRRFVVFIEVDETAKARVIAGSLLLLAVALWRLLE